MANEDVPVRLEAASKAFQSPGVRRLTLLFIAAYVVQALGRHNSPLMSQALKNLFTQQLGFSASQFADYFFWVAFPWMLKPLMGLISDLLPIGGYRKRSYMVLASFLAFASLAGLWFVESAWTVRIILFLSSLGIAFSDVIADALVVVHGPKSGLTGRFQSTQYVWYGVAAMGAGWLGGWLCGNFSPVIALRLAGTCAGIAVLGLLLATLRETSESRVVFDRMEWRRSVAAIHSVLRTPDVWKLSLIVFLVKFAPNLGTAYYVFRSDVLHMSKASIGYGETLASFGGLIGALVFAKLLADRFPPRRLFIYAMLIEASGTLSYFLVRDVYTSYAAGFLYTGFDMVSGLALLCVITEGCPKASPAFAFAVMASFTNLASQLGDQVGARIFEASGKTLGPLILCSAATTLSAILLQRMLSAPSSRLQEATP